jgi:hypothetical protein
MTSYAPQESAGRKGMWGLVLGVSVLLVLLLGVGLLAAVALLSTPDSREEAASGSSSAASDPGGDGPAPIEEVESDAEAEMPGIGDSVEAGGIRVTLNGVRNLPETEFDPARSGNVFLAVDLTFENVSDEPVALSSIMEFALKDEDGYSADQTVHTEQRSLTEGNLSPGQRTSGEIVYEVLADAEGLQLDYAPFLAGETYVWEIGSAAGAEAASVGASALDPSGVRASGVSDPAPDAGGQTVTYEPEQVLDGRPDTAWHVDGDGIGEWIELEYDSPVVVSEIGIIPGYDKYDPADGIDRFYQMYVVREAEITFSDGTTVTASFDRDPTMQYVSVPDVETTYVRITILDTYPPGNSPYGDEYPYTLDKVAISEILVDGN